MKKAISESDPDAEIRSFISETGKMLKAHAVYIFTVIGDRIYDRTYVWREDGRPSRPDLQTITEDEFIPAWWEAFHEDRMIIETDMSRYRAVLPEGYRRIQDAELQTMVLCPVVLDHYVYGLTVYSNVAEEFLHGSNAIFEINTAYIAMMLRHRKNRRYIDNVTYYDQITRLYNLNSFQQSLSTFIEKQRSGEKSGVWDVVCFNISQFKLFNNKYGYVEGNNLLVDLARTIRTYLEAEYLTRAEADRFYCLVEDERAEDLVRNVSNSMKNNGARSAYVYAGIYTLTTEEKEARYALDYAKLAADQASGDYHKSYLRFDPQMLAAKKMEAYLVEHVDEAVSSGWIKTFYQPVIRPLSSRVASMEALVRWQDPNYGLLMPGAFINVLEQHHLMIKVDLCMIENICRDIADRKNKGFAAIPISFNLSRYDLSVPDLHEQINAILERYGVQSSTLSVEITETVIQDKNIDIVNHIERFHQDGFQVWIDDFGSGYSSFSELKNYDFDMVKIDMDFLRNPNAKTPLILRSIIYMAEQLGVRTLAEGVEEQEQIQFLKKQKCNYLQGYYYSRPMELSELISSLGRKGIETETDHDRTHFEKIEKKVAIRKDPITSKDEIFHATDMNTEGECIIEYQPEERRTIYFNDEYVRFIKSLGFESPEQVDSYENNRNHKQAHLDLVNAVRKTLESGGDYNFSFVVNGHIGFVHLVLLEQDEDSITIRVIVNKRTSLTNGLQALFEGDNLEMVFDSCYEGIVITDTYTKILYVNPMAERMLGFSAEQLKGKCCSELELCRTDSGKIAMCQASCPVLKAVRSGESLTSDRVLRKADGGWTKVTSQIVPVIDEQKNVVQIVQLFRER